MILIDGGNLISATKKHPDLYAELILEAYNRMAYDALSIGSVELKMGPELIRRMAGVAHFPLVSANALSGDPACQPFVIKTVHGVRVAITGVVSPQLVNAGEAVSIQSVQDAARDTVGRLRPEADLIVLMAHLPYTETVDLIQSVPGIDVAVVGLMAEPQEGRTVDRTHVVAPGDNGETVTIIEVAWDKRKRSVVRMQSSNHLLDETVADDPGFYELVEAFNARMDQRRIEIYEQKSKKHMQDIQQMTKKTLKMSPQEFLSNYDSNFQPKKGSQP